MQQPRHTLMQLHEDIFSDDLMDQNVQLRMMIYDPYSTVPILTEVPDMQEFIYDHLQIQTIIIIQILQPIL